MAFPEPILIQRLKDREENAFRELVESYKDKVFNTCLGFLKNREDADDATQEVFVEVYNSIQKFREESGLSTWIYRIAVNKSLEHLRKLKRKKRSGILRRIFSSEDDNDWQIPDFEHPGVKAENKERAKILSAAIEKLPESQQIAFTLHKLEGLSYEQIAGIMKRSLSSVESLMHRARGNLKNYLHDYYYNQ